MAMAVGGGKGGPKGDINMTPMIDILLVLLIIFMADLTGCRRMVWMLWRLSRRLRIPSRTMPTMIAPSSSSSTSRAT